jgi:hypothetical protein
MLYPILSQFITKNHPHPHKEIQYMELYAGAANVWRAVSQSYPSVRADLTYGSSSQPESKQNPMDVLTSAGFAIPSCILMVMICESWIRCAVTHSSRKAPSDCLFNYICPMYYTCCICSTRTAKVSANNNKDLHLASPPMCWKRLLRTTCNSVQFVGTG